jgi:hypothetical protein
MGQQGALLFGKGVKINRTSAGGGGKEVRPFWNSEYEVLKALLTIELSWAGFRVKILP